jgi:proline iminopeptidase
MKLKILFYSLLSILLFSNCEQKKEEDPIKANYLDYSKREFNIWRYKNDSYYYTKGTLKCGQKTVGNNPTIKVLLLTVDLINT